MHTSITKRYINFGLILLSLFITISCNNEEESIETSPSYIGTWGEDNIAGTNGQYSTLRNVMIFTIDSYTNETQTNVYGWETLWGRKGIISVDGDVMTKISIQSYESVYDSEYEHIGYSYQDMLPADCDTVEMKWVVKGNKLKLITDVNKNGIFDAVNDVVDIEDIYTKL